MVTLFQNIRKRALSLLAGASLLAAAACEPGAIGTVGAGVAGGPRVDLSKPVPVALLVPQSGSATDRTLAQSVENAARLAVKDLAGNATIDLRVYDTGGSAAGGAAAAQRAIADGATVFVGPIFSQAANAAGVVASQKGVSVLSLSNNTAIAGGNVFVLGNTFDNTARRLASYARSQGRKRIMIVHAQNVAGEAGRNAVATALARQGMAPASVNGYEFSQQGVINAANKIAAAHKASGADAIFLTSESAGALPLLAELLPERGVNPATTQYIGLTRWDIPAQTLGLKGLNGGWFALPDPNRSKQFADRYAASYGASPHPLASVGYDGIAAVGALIVNGGSAPFSPANVAQGRGFQGATGAFRLLPDGTNQRAIAIAQIRDGSYAIVSPAGGIGAGF